jgi:signal peptidase I
MNKTVKTIGEYLLIIAFVIIMRIFIITPIEVNGRSMEDTLYNNDIMILNIVGYHASGLKRFDIVVIKYNDEHLIKRIIGLPGETVEYRDNLLYINGKVIEDVVDDTTADFKTLDMSDDGVVPDDMYFVLGDNRNNSSDSRVIGFISKDDILGKTNLILFPLNRFGIVK